MIPPPYGICLPCTWHRNRDADTPEVRLRTGQVVAVRLIDCWARDGDEKADAFAEKLLDDFDGMMSVWFPLPETGRDDQVDITDILRAASFDRVPGRVFLGTRDLSEILVTYGYATKERAE